MRIEEETIRKIVLPMAIVLAIAGTTIPALTGCDPRGYLGHDCELFTVAANNVIGAGCAITENTSVVETDSFGRTLFFYENSGSGFGANYALGVCQKSDESYAYYYEDDCIILCDRSGKVSDERLAALKELNDWERELDDGGEDNHQHVPKGRVSGGQIRENADRVRDGSAGASRRLSLGDNRYMLRFI